MQQEKYKGWLLKLQGNSKFSQVWDKPISSPLPLHCFELLKYLKYSNSVVQMFWTTEKEWSIFMVLCLYSVNPYQLGKL